MTATKQSVNESAVQERRAQIVRAAGSVLHTQGYDGTTLRIVAAKARLPLGNLYYYFRSKEDLAIAVIEARVADIEAMFAHLEAQPRWSPLRRIQRFVAAFEANAAQLVLHGCPYGVLSQDLSRRPGPLATKARGLLEVQLVWLTAQFRATGAGARSRRRAAELVCAIQGACLLGLALRDAGILRQRLREISRQLATDSALTS